MNSRQFATTGAVTAGDGYGFTAGTERVCMDERAVLSKLATYLPDAGDDAAVVDDLVITTDMLHESTDFPDGTTRYTAGWRAVGASLSDIAAMGAKGVASVAVYAAPSFRWEEISSFVDGAQAVCASGDAAYVGGDLDNHEEFTVVSTAIGRTDNPVFRTGATPGDIVCVTGRLGRTGAACEYFARGDVDRGNELFQFQPRLAAGQSLARYATALMDSSDGLARSLHQLAEASDCGFAIESPLPYTEMFEELGLDSEQQREYGVFFGEDFELVCTLPAEKVDNAQADLSVSLTPIGTVTEQGITLDGENLPDRGYTH